MRLLAGGAVAEDLDGDGSIDLFVANADGPSSLFWNRGDGTFDEGAASAGVLFEGDWVAAVGAADYDNDGDQDLFLLTRDVDRLLRNEGGRRFVDVAAAAGFAFEGAGTGITFGDLDNDGWLDAFVGLTALGTPGNTEIEGEQSILQVDLTPSRILKGNKNGVFTDMSARIGMPDGNPLASGLLDLDADGDLDLYVIQDAQRRVRNLLFENAGPDGDGFVNLVNVSQGCGCEDPWAGMGLGVLDIDDNGLPEMFISNFWIVPPNREALFLNLGGLRFQDIAAEVGASSMDPYLTPGNRSVSWAAATLDVENDSLEDIFVVYGELVWNGSAGADPVAYPHLAKGQPDALLSRRYNGKFEVQEGTGLEDPGRAHSAVVADFDADGCEDIYVVNLETPARLYRNRCEGRSHYLDLQLQGTRTNRDGVGARVRIEALGRVQWRHVLGCSAGIHSCMPKRVHFGLAHADRVEKVDIYWPGGHIQHIGSLAVDQLHHVVESAL